MENEFKKNLQSTRPRPSLLVILYHLLDHALIIVIFSTIKRIMYLFD